MNVFMRMECLEIFEEERKSHYNFSLELHVSIAGRESTFWGHDIYIQRDNNGNHEFGKRNKMTAQ